MTNYNKNSCKSLPFPNGSEAGDILTNAVKLASSLHLASHSLRKNIRRLSKDAEGLSSSRRGAQF